MTIANEFNKFFTNIWPNLANKLSNVDGDISDYLDGSFQNSMCDIHIDPIEIQNITNHLKSSSNKGVDGVSTKIVKEVIEVIAQPPATVLTLWTSNLFSMRHLLNALSQSKGQTSKGLTFIKKFKWLIYNIFAFLCIFDGFLNFWECCLWKAYQTLSPCQNFPTGQPAKSAWQVLTTKIPKF